MYNITSRKFYWRLSVASKHWKTSFPSNQLKRCVNELGFVGCNMSTDTCPVDIGKTPPITDRWWYPFYEKLVELEVPAMIHPSSSANKNFHTTGAHFINGDTTAFMQLIQGDLFADFPTLKLTIPHAGGAVPFHWAAIAV